MLAICTLLHDLLAVLVACSPLATLLVCLLLALMVGAFTADCIYTACYSMPAPHHVYR